MTAWKLRTLLAGVVLTAYANSFGLGAAMDGAVILQQDQRIQAASGTNLRLILDKPYWWPSAGDRLYRPVTTASFLFNYAILGNGPNAGGYHAVNFLLHALNVLLVFELALLLFQRAGPAFFAAALWGVHPIGVESVANIAGRADLLAAAGVLGGLVLYIRAAEAAGRRRWIALAGLAALSAFGVFAKENGAVLIGLMLLWDVAFGTWSKRRGWAYAAAGLPVVLFWWARTAVFRSAPIPPVNVVDNPLLAAGFLDSRLTAIKILAKDLWLLMCPMRLTADRSYHVIPVSGPGDPMVWLALLLVVAVLGVAIARFRKDRLIFWSAGFLGIALLPTSNLVVRIGAAMAERFLYLPAAGFCVAAVALAWRLKPQKAGVAVVAVALVLCAGRTFARNPAWNDNLALATADVQTSTDSFRLHDMLGQYLYQQNPKSNLDRAIQELETAWNILKPLPPEQSFQATPAMLGMYYGLKGDLEGGAATEQGRTWYERSLNTLQAGKRISLAVQKAFDEQQTARGLPLPPLIGFEGLDFYLGQAYWRLGRQAEAIEWYARGRTRRPDNPVGYEILAKAYADEGDWDHAVVVLGEKLLIGGSTPASLAALREAYSRIPDGACAVVRSAGIDQINPGCPRLRSDMCKALADLERTFREGRQSERARSFQESSIRDYGCSGSK